MDIRFVGITAALFSAFSWAAGAVMYRRIGESASAPGINFVKGLFSLVLLAAALMLSGFDRILPETFIILGVSGLIGISLGDTFFFEALRRISPQLLVLLSLSGQVLTVLLAVLFLGESLSAGMIAGIIMIIGGICIVLCSQITGRGSSSLSGILYGLMSMLCMSVSVIIAKTALSSVSAIQATFIRMLFGTAGVAVAGILSKRLKTWISPFEDMELMRKISVAVCIVTFGGFWLFHVSIKYIEVSVANTLSSVEPLFVIPLAAVFLKEKVTTAAVVGSLISTFGIIVLIAG